MPVDTAPAPVPLGQDVFALDTRMSGYEGITAAYAILGERPCLIETGTAASAPVVAAALEGLGVGPDDLAVLVVTHIHLDHAGGVGDLARLYPKARIVVQERGARHLADPTRLMASARLVFGSVLDDVFGPLAPTCRRADRRDRRVRRDRPRRRAHAAGTPRTGPRKPPHRPGRLGHRRPVRRRRRRHLDPRDAGPPADDAPAGLRPGLGPRHPGPLPVVPADEAAVQPLRPGRRGR